ncbi:MAG: DsbC family protein [Betaproteobacteria bacterium]|nr:DsbC family protein [Betaproteobacteria bacterium]
MTKTKDILVAIILTLFAALTLYYQYRDKEPATAEEALLAVLAKVEGSIRLDELDLGNAIKQVRGNGEPILVSFEDPNCSYCVKLDKKLNHLDNVTLYTFLIPILSEDSVIRARRIWCAPNPATAWNDWMLKRRLPSGAGECDTTAIDRNLVLGETMGIRGVPHLFQAK